MYMGPKRKEPPPPSPSDSEISTNIASPYTPFTSPSDSEVPTVVREPTDSEVKNYHEYMHKRMYLTPPPVIRLPLDQNETATIRRTPPSPVKKSKKYGGSRKRKRRRKTAKRRRYKVFL